MIDRWLATAEAYLDHRTAIAALVSGFVVSWVLTQGWKATLFKDLSDDRARFATRVLAFVTGFVPTAIMWPVSGAPRWVFAVVVGLASPAAYTLAVRIVGHFWPWLADRVSARPGTP